VIDDLIQGIKNKKVRSISKAITLIENNNKSSSKILSKLYPLNNHTHRIGITGPPGAGKSTITNLLIKYFRENKQSVAVLLVDPTSPYSNGAVLGDRIRMYNHYNDNNVFIRSFATRGSKGGLSKNINEIADVLQAAKYDIILFETVGVKVGPSLTTLETIPFRTTSSLLSSPVDTLLAGDKEIEFRDDYNSDGFIFIKQDQPLPCSVLAIYPTLVTSDG